MDLRCPICRARLFVGKTGEPECMCGFKLDTKNKTGSFEASPLILPHNLNRIKILELVSKYKPDYVVSTNYYDDSEFTLSDVTFIYELEVPDNIDTDITCCKLNTNKSIDFDFLEVFYIKGYWVPNFLKYATAVSRSAPNGVLQPLDFNKVPLDKALYLMCLMESDYHKGHSWMDIIPVLTLGALCVENVASGFSSEVITFDKIDSALAFNFAFGPFYKEFGRVPVNSISEELNKTIDKRTTDIQKMLPTFETQLSEYVRDIFNGAKLDNPIVKDYIELYLGSKHNASSNDIYSLVDAAYADGIDLGWYDFLVKYPMDKYYHFNINYWKFIKKLKHETHYGYPDYDYGRDYKISYTNSKEDCGTKELITKFYDEFEME